MTTPNESTVQSPQTTYVDCIVQTKSGNLSKRLFCIQDPHFILLKVKKSGNHKEKIRKELAQMIANYEPNVQTVQTHKSTSQSSKGSKLFPIRMKLSSREKLTLYFETESARKKSINFIMNAMGYESQLEQYHIIEYLGSTTLKARHKVTGQTVVVKVISKQQQSKDQDEKQLNEIDLEAELRPLKLSGHNDLVDYIIDDVFIYVIRPYYNCGNLVRVLKQQRINLLTEQEIRAYTAPVL